jgi:hypothetical protein
MLKYLPILLFMFACSKNEAQPVVVKVVDQGIVVVKDKSLPLDQSLPVKDQEVKEVSLDEKYEAPEAFDCEKFFTAEGIEEAHKTNSPYIADKEYYFIEKNADYVLTAKLGYLPQEKFLAIFMTTVGKKKVCYQKETQLMVTLLLDEKKDERRSYMLDGIHKQNCGNARKIQDKNKAISIYLVPELSKFFQMALISRSLGAFARFDSKYNGIVGQHYSVNHSLAFMNGLRCAYKAMGYKHLKVTNLLDNTAEDF